MKVAVSKLLLCLASALTSRIIDFTPYNSAQDFDCCRFKLCVNVVFLEGWVNSPQDSRLGELAYEALGVTQ
jgi:hypothetical protein